MHGIRVKRPGGRAATASCLAAALLAGGCGGRGEISGKVTFNNEPIPWGRVHFTSESGSNEVLHSPIINGQYKIINCPMGAVKISVESFKAPNMPPGKEVEMAKGFKEMMKDRGEGPPVEVAGKYVPIPARYAVADQSGLTYNVSRGEQTHDIPLSP